MSIDHLNRDPAAEEKEQACRYTAEALGSLQCEIKEERSYLVTTAQYRASFPDYYSPQVDKLFAPFEDQINNQSEGLWQRLGVNPDNLKVNPRAFLENFIRRELSYSNYPEGVERGVRSTVGNISERVSEQLQLAQIYSGLGGDYSLGPMQIRPSNAAAVFLSGNGQSVPAGADPEKIMEQFHEFMENNPDKDFPEMENDSRWDMVGRETFRLRILLDKYVLDEAGALDTAVSMLAMKMPGAGEPIPAYVYPEGHRTRISISAQEGGYQHTMIDPHSGARRSHVITPEEMRLASALAAYQGYGLSFATKDPTSTPGERISLSGTDALSPEVMATVSPNIS